MQYIPHTQDMSYFYFDHGISTKDRYNRALSQWRLVKLDKNLVNDHKAGAGSTYIRWVQEELRHRPSNSRRPSTDESITKDHVQKIRVTLNQEGVIQTWIERENGQLQIDLQNAQAKIS